MRTVASWNPIAGSPAAGLETEAAVDAYGPSLMPRAALHQGMAAGLSVLAARSVGAIAEDATRALSRNSSSTGRRLAAAAAVAGSGQVLAHIPRRDGESLAISAARSSGQLITHGVISGAAYDLAMTLRGRIPGRAAPRIALVSLSSAAGMMLVVRKRLHAREKLVQEWTEHDRPADLTRSMLIAHAVTLAGAGLARAYVGTRDLSIRFFGRDPAHQMFARVVNAAGWAAAVSLAYHAGVARIGRANENIEPTYADPPTSPLRSGSPPSKAPFEELGLEGRRYVTDVVTSELIERTLAEPAVAEPIRAYVGYNTEPLYANGRAEIALDELERMGAFSRSHLLLVSPTGTGWIDQAVIESAELLTRGDIATCAIQYGRFPSFLCTQKVPIGRAQFRALLWGVKQRLAAVPTGHRPRVLVFGESLGAWTSSDTTMRAGIAGLDEYGVDRALWFGLPGLAVWSKTGMKEGRSPLMPPGTVGHFDHYEQFAALSDEQRDQLRVVVVDHDNDPIASLSPRLIYARPDWLGDQRGRGVPTSMRWIPVVTFVHTAVDAMNAMRTVPGQFKSFGHDYRADTARFVHAAFRLPAVTEAQMAAVEHALRALELDRGRASTPPAGLTALTEAKVHTGSAPSASTIRARVAPSRSAGQRLRARHNLNARYGAPQHMRTRSVPHGRAQEPERYPTATSAPPAPHPRLPSRPPQMQLLRRIPPCPLHDDPERRSEETTTSAARATPRIALMSERLRQVWDDGGAANLGLNPGI